MRAFVLSIAVSSAMLFASTARATEWYHLSSNPTGEVYVDEDSLVDDESDSVEVWTFTIFGPWNLTLKEERTHYEVDCEDLTYRELERTTFHKDGSSEAITEPSDWLSMPPGTTIGKLRDYACGLDDVGGSEVDNPALDAQARFANR